MLNNSELVSMPLYHMTPKQVADRLIAERLKVDDNAKALQKAAINKSAAARRKIEDFKIEHEHEKA